MSTLLTLDEKLDLLIEECSEVIQAASKIKRFGFDVDQGFGNNKIKLSSECGDIVGVIFSLPLDAEAYTKARLNKIKRAEGFKETHGIKND